MNISCKVIQDLLPLYHDNVCSPESSAMIEEHLKDCEACQEEFHKLEESPLAKNGKKEEAEKENVQRMKEREKGAAEKACACFRHHGGGGSAALHPRLVCHEPAVPRR